MARKDRRSDHRADLRGQPFIGLPAAVVHSPAYTTLSLAARAVLTEILGRFNGWNNGDIAISSRELCERLNTTNAKRILDATTELLTHGLIDIPAEGKWKARQARLFRLTFISSGKAPPYRQATNDYAHIPPEAFSRANNASAEKPRFAERALAGTLGLANNASATANGNPPTGGLEPADNASALIGKPYQGPFIGQAQTDQHAPLKGGGPISTIIDGPWAGPVCEHCGKPFAPAGRGQPKRFCSEPCRKRAETQRRNQRRAQT